MENKQNNYDTTSQEISLKDVILKIQDWILYLVSKWYTLAGGLLLGVIIGFLYVKRMDTTFSGITTFVLENGENGNLSSYSGMANLMGIDIGGGKGNGIFQGDNIFELYKSRKMLEKTLLSKTFPDSNELLIERYIFFNHIKEGWEKAGRKDLIGLNFAHERGDLSESALRLRDSLIGNFSNEINKNLLSVGKADKNTSIIKVEVVSQDEIFSKAFSETLVSIVNDFYIQTKTSKSLKNIAILQDKVDSVRAVLTGAINTTAYVFDSTPNLNPTRQAQRIAPSQNAQFSAETSKAVLGQLLQNLEMSKMKLLQEQPLIQIVEEPIYPLQKNSPNLKRTVILFGFFTIFFTSIILIIALEYRNLMK